MNSEHDTGRLQNRYLRYALPLLSAILVIFVASCRAGASAGTRSHDVSIGTHAGSTAPQPYAVSTPQPYTETYYYYPANEVYYSPTRSTYYWYEGQTWQTGSTLPKTYYIDNSSPVTLRLDTAQPYTVHNQTVVRYPRR